MPDKDLIVISYAHSCTSVGVMSEDRILNEHIVSARAAQQAFRNLHHDLPICLLDCGPIRTAHEYARWKIDRINALNPTLAVEIHCNSAESPMRRYSEVIHHRSGGNGELAAKLVAAELKNTLTDVDVLGRKVWEHRGARANSVALDRHLFFFLEELRCPSIIVEGMFLTNPEHVKRLSDGGMEAYGAIVGEGIRKFWNAVNK